MQFSMLLGLFGGLGLFLYGMQRMAEGLQKAAGDKMRRILELFTSHPVVAIITGAVATVLVQSSSTTTVMIVGFVNAGLMTLKQAVGTIMGANVGTTITAQVVSFNIYEVALPAVGIGFAVQLLGRRKAHKYLGLSVLGFGILLLGMQTMSQSLAPLRTFQPFLDGLVYLGQNPILGVLAGALFTVAVQSSSATTGLVIAFTLQDMLSLPAGLALILGANLGTCVTAGLASIGAGVTARRAAMAHVLFNSVGVLVFLLVLRPFSDLVAQTGTSVTRQVANAHTIFNVVNTLLLFPFIGPFVRLVERLVPGEEDILDTKPRFLDERMLHSPAALVMAKKELLRMARLSLEMFEEAVESFTGGDEKKIQSVLKKEDVVNALEKAIAVYLAEASQDPMTARQSNRITGLMHIINDLERVGDHATNITELAEERMNHNLQLSEHAQEELAQMYGEVLRIYSRSIEVLESEDASAARNLLREDEIIDDLENKFRDSHIKRLNEGLCHPETGVLFLDLISNLERIGDHANNIAEAVADVITASADYTGRDTQEKTSSLAV